MSGCYIYFPSMTSVPDAHSEQGSTFPLLVWVNACLSCLDSPSPFCCTPIPAPARQQQRIGPMWGRRTDVGLCAGGSAPLCSLG